MTVERPRYYERQVLSAAALVGEQAYLISMRRRHQIGAHGWGVVGGLDISEENGQPVLEPGMAIDGYGRELIVPQPVALPTEALAAWLEAGGVDLWLLYGRTPLDPQERGRWDCGSNRHARWVEEARLCLTPAPGETDFDPRRPPGAPQEDLDFGPYEDPPDDPDRRFPVYLGRVQRKPGKQDNMQGPARPNVRLMGARVEGKVLAPVEDATGTAGVTGATTTLGKVGIREVEMQIDAESPAHRQVFEVNLPGYEDRLAVDRQGNLTVQGHTTLAGDLSGKSRSDLVVYGDVTAPAGERGPASGVEFESLTEPPKAAAPWRVYRTVVERGTGDAKRRVNQLRFEIAHPGEKDDPRRCRFVVGAWSGNRFVPCLTVDANCDVTVAGRLEVSGTVTEGPVKPDPDDPRFTEALIAQWLRGLQGATSRISGLDLSIEAPDESMASFDLTYTLMIRNSSKGRVTNIRAYESLSLDNNLVRRGRMNADDLTLEAGSSTTIEGHYIPQAVGTLTITISVVGAGSEGNALFNSALKQIRIDPPNPG